jgi:tetratricopeptide (TPR) repeat protein
VLSKQGRSDEALCVFESLCAKCPDDPYTLTAYVDFLVHDRPRRALNDFDRVTGNQEVVPPGTAPSPALLVARARLLRKLDRLREAKLEVERLAGRYPSYAPVWQEYSRLIEVSGNAEGKRGSVPGQIALYEEARTHSRKALELDPLYEPARSALDRIASKIAKAQEDLRP